MKLDSGDVEIPASSVSVYEAIFRRRNVKGILNSRARRFPARRWSGSFPRQSGLPIIG